VLDGPSFPSIDEVNRSIPALQQKRVRELSALFLFQRGHSPPGAPLVFGHRKAQVSAARIGVIESQQDTPVCQPDRA
jgi:hypothetical protein